MLHFIKIVMTLCAASLLISCAAISTHEHPPTQPSVVVNSEEASSQQTLESTPESVEAKSEVIEPQRNTAATILGTVLLTAVTIWAVTEYIEEKVVPVVVTLVVVGLVYEASRNSDATADLN